MTRKEGGAVEAEQARELLRRGPALRRELTESGERLARARQAAGLRSRGDDGVRGQRGAPRPDGPEEAVLRYLALREELEPRMERIRAALRRIEGAVWAVEDGLARELLRQRYLDAEGWSPTPWRQVARRVYGDDGEKELLRVHRAHRRALSAFAAAYEQAETSDPVYFPALSRLPQRNLDLTKTP